MLSSQYQKQNEMKKPTEKRKVGRPRSENHKYCISTKPQFIDKIRAYAKELNKTKPNE